MLRLRTLRRMRLLWSSDLSCGKQAASRCAERFFCLQLSVAEEKPAVLHREGAEGGIPIPQTAGIEDREGLGDRQVAAGTVGGEMELQGDVGMAKDQHVGVSAQGTGDGLPRPALDSVAVAVHEEDADPLPGNELLLRCLEEAAADDQRAMEPIAVA